jgi:hypothetical protein
MQYGSKPDLGQHIADDGSDSEKQSLFDYSFPPFRWLRCLFAYLRSNTLNAGIHGVKLRRHDFDGRAEPVQNFILFFQLVDSVRVAFAPLVSFNKHFDLVIVHSADLLF